MTHVLAVVGKNINDVVYRAGLSRLSQTPPLLSVSESGSSTKTTMELAKTNNVELMNRDQLINMLLETNLEIDSSIDIPEKAVNSINEGKTFQIARGVKQQWC